MRNPARAYQMYQCDRRVLLRAEGSEEPTEGNEMLPYERVRAMQEVRAARFVKENDRALARRKAAKKEPGALSDLLSALAGGLASIGYRGPMRGHPAKPAF